MIFRWLVDNTENRPSNWRVLYAEHLTDGSPVAGEDDTIGDAGSHPIDGQGGWTVGRTPICHQRLCEQQLMTLQASMLDSGVGVSDHECDLHRNFKVGMLSVQTLQNLVPSRSTPAFKLSTPPRMVNLHTWLNSEPRLVSPRVTQYPEVIDQTATSFAGEGHRRGYPLTGRTSN